MSSLLRRVSDSLFHVYQRRDLSRWEHQPLIRRPIYGVYHVYCARGWQGLVSAQLKRLRESGLLDASSKLYVSIIAPDKKDVGAFLRIADSDKVELVAVHEDPSRYEYPALEYLANVAKREDCLLYYFHTKGISYQGVGINDRLYRSFSRKIEAWREMLEYFVFAKWQVAVNVLDEGYDTYGCYQWPPKGYTMFSGNFWWVSSDYARRLPAFTPQAISGNRFYSEVWLYQLPHRTFSAFETIADLYFVRIYPPPIRRFPPLFLEGPLAIRANLQLAQVIEARRHQLQATLPTSFPAVSHRQYPITLTPWRH